jgi:hypothetical protein
MRIKHEFLIEAECLLTGAECFKISWMMSKKNNRLLFISCEIELKLLDFFLLCNLHAVYNPSMILKLFLAESLPLVQNNSIFFG